MAQNRHTGEQMTHWDMLKKATKFEFSLFNMSQWVICCPVWQFLYHVIAQLQKADCTATVLEFSKHQQQLGPRPSSSKPDEASPRLVENFNRYLSTVKEGFFTRVGSKEK